MKNVSLEIKNMIRKFSRKKGNRLDWYAAHYYYELFSEGIGGLVHSALQRDIGKKVVDEKRKR